MEALGPPSHAVEATERAGDAYADARARPLRGIAHRAALEVHRSGERAWNEAAVAHDVARALRAEGRSDEAVPDED